MPRRAGRFQRFNNNVEVVTAFSRVEETKVYVQDRVEERRPRSRKCW